MPRAPWPRVAETHRGQLVVVFCHGGVVEASLLAFLPVAPERGRLKLRTEHTSLTEWETGRRGWRLLRYNDAAHLRTLAGDRRACRPRPAGSAGVVAVETLAVGLVGVLGDAHAPGGQEVAVLGRVGDGIGAVARASPVYHATHSGTAGW